MTGTSLCGFAVCTSVLCSQLIGPSTERFPTQPTITGGAVSFAANRVLTCHFEKNAKVGIWELDSGKLLQWITCSDDEDALAICGGSSPDGQFVALSIYPANQTVIIDLTSGNVLRRLPQPNFVRWLDNQVYVACPKNSVGAMVVQMYDISKTDPIKEFSIARNAEKIDWFECSSDRIAYFVIADSGERVDEVERRVVAFDLNSQKELERRPSRMIGHSPQLLIGGGEYLVLADGRHIEIVKRSTWEIKWRFDPKMTDSGVAVSVSANGKYLALAGTSVRIVDVAAAESIADLQVPGSATSWPALIPHPMYVGENGELDAASELDRNMLVCLELDRDARRLAGITSGGMVIRWDLESRTLERTYPLEGSGSSLPGDDLTIEDCFSKLRSDKVEERRLAIYQLLRREFPKESVAELTDRLGDTDTYVRAAAIQAFAAMRIAHEPAVAALIDCLKRDELRESAVYAIVQSRLTNRIPLQVLLDALDDANPLVVGIVAQALAAHGPRAAEGCLKLGELLTDRRPRELEWISVRQAVSDALRSLGQAAAPALPAIIDSLHDPSSYVRESSCRALAALAEHAQPAVAVLQSLTDDKDSSVRSAATDALAAIPGKQW